MSGDCFMVALHLALKKHGATVVHGVPVGRGAANRGKRYAHAWVELDGRVLDYANGRKIEMATGTYYALGYMTEKNVRRYEPLEALEIAIDHGHYGPWDEELDQQCEVEA